eukprot:Platyproteum_vivax@DN12160_c0_g1_i2.p1
MYDCLPEWLVYIPNHQHRDANYYLYESFFRSPAFLSALTSHKPPAAFGVFTNKRVWKKASYSLEGAGRLLTRMYEDFIGPVPPEFHFNESAVFVVHKRVIHKRPHSVWRSYYDAVSSRFPYPATHTSIAPQLQSFLCELFFCFEEGSLVVDFSVLD